MHNLHDIEDMLTEQKPVLDVREREVLWGRIAKSLTPRTAVKSPYAAFFHERRTVALAFLFVLLVIGGSGTTLAANAARPGDFLFPVERAIENTRLRLTSDPESRNTLKAEFEMERINELRAIIGESSIVKQHTESDRDNSDDRDARVATSSVATGSDDSRGYTTSIRKEDEVRVGQAVDAIIKYIDDTADDSDERVRVLTNVYGTIDEYSLRVDVDDSKERESENRERIEVRQNNRGDSELRVRDDTKRIRIKKEHGEVRVETELEDDDNSRSDDDSDRSNSGSVINSQDDSGDDDRDDSKNRGKGSDN